MLVFCRLFIVASGKPGNSILYSVSLGHVALLELTLGGASLAVLCWKLILNTNFSSTKADGVGTLTSQCYIKTHC